jgi:hypothetical protein
LPYLPGGRWAAIELLAAVGAVCAPLRAEIIGPRAATTRLPHLCRITSTPNPQ